MDSTRASALVISGKGSLRDGLAALLSAMPQIGPVRTARALGDALGETSPGWRPTLVLLDVRASSESAHLAVRRVKGRWQACRCVVLAENVAQQAEAEEAGADAVIMNGIQAPRLAAAIVGLIPRVEDADQVPATGSHDDVEA